MGGGQHRDLAQRGGGRVSAGDAGGGQVGGVLLSAGRGERGPQVELAVRGVDRRHRPVRRPGPTGVDCLGLLALGDPLGGGRLLAGALGGHLAVRLFVELPDHTADLRPAAHHERGQPGVAAGEVAVLVGEHGTQLCLGQTRQQRHTEVDVGGEHDPAGGAGARGRREVPDQGPQPGFVGLGDRDAGRLLAPGRAQHEHAPYDGDGEQHRDDGELHGDRAVPPGEHRDVETGQRPQQHEAQQVEAEQQNKSAQCAQSCAHRADPPTGSGEADMANTAKRSCR